MVKRGDVDELTISTVVTINNLVGRVYFFVVKRFHRIIVPVIGRRMVGNIDDYLLNSVSLTSKR